jgi:diguanylate cyclase (GGDEF)-like protein
MIVHGPTAQKAGKVLVINADPEITNILEVNLAHANLDVISAQSGTEALKKIHQHKADIIILDPSLPDMDYEEIRHQIKESLHNDDIPIILLSAKIKKRNIPAKAEDTAVYYITKPFDPKEVVALVQGYLMHKERQVNIDPLTGLPNRIQVNKEIARLIEKKTTFAVIYIAMHDFKAVNRVYGYTQGDRIIQLLADIVSEAVRLFGNPDDLAGHFGADKFVVVSTPWKSRTLCRRIIADYNRRIKALFTEEHLQVGHATLEGAAAIQEEPPNMSIHIAVITNQKRTFDHPLEVTGYASDQMEYLKSSPESNCYFDLKLSGVEPPPSVTERNITQVNKEELRITQGLLAWLDFITGEMENSLTNMKDSLRSLEPKKAKNLSPEQRKEIKSLGSSYEQLARVREGFANLANAEWLRTAKLFDEVNIGNTLNWVMEQVQGLARRKKIKVAIKGADDIGEILGDRRSLNQSLLYIIRHEIRSAPAGSHLKIRLAEKNDENIYLEITNPDHYFPPRALNDLVRGQTDAIKPETLKNEFFPARVLIRGLGGKLDVTSDKETGTTYQITLPNKWQSGMAEVNTLQLAMDISRKEARDTLRNMLNSLTTPLGEVSPAVKDVYDRLGGKIQELAVLGNRALFLADDYNSRLEFLQDSLLQQESERLAMSEAILAICRGRATSMRIKHLFDLESARRVIRYALAIAKEFKISYKERQALHHAALLKDIALAFSRRETDEKIVSADRETMAALKEYLNRIWKAISTIPFFSPACNILLYRYERYDGTGGRFGAKGTEIPLGSRILAVVDTMDTLTSNRSTQGKLAPRLAIEQIVADSGLRFDPHVISALLMLWKRNELNVSPESD